MSLVVVSRKEKVTWLVWYGFAVTFKWLFKIQCMYLKIHTLYLEQPEASVIKSDLSGRIYVRDELFVLDG